MCPGGFPVRLPQSMVGATLSHYRILGHLGAGGMGAVYHALDVDLGRPVAIKVLRPEFAQQPDWRQRFLREARAAAALNHPNICAIHEVGRADDELFIVMQLVQGQTLATMLAARPLDSATVDRVATQLADALAAAHRHGIVHRDLKPSNIMIGPNHEATILDFGVAAMRIDPVHLAEATTATNPVLTDGDHAVGTVAYMSPEQIRGGHVGPASDVFSLGTTLYEAATGRHPFVRANDLHTIAAVLGDDPPAVRSIVPDFPASLDDIVLTCLSKRPEARYHDGDALATALRQVVVSRRPAPKPRPHHHSLAVLPLLSVPGDSTDDYLGEALATEIITKVAKLKGMRVTSPSATLRYRNADRDARQIGRELEVDTVLEGGISKRGQQYRITVQLLEVHSGFCVWGGKYDFAADDLFHIQEEVATRVARALRAKRTVRQGGASAPQTTSAEAYRLYLQGQTLYYRFNSTDNLLAIEAFRRALALDERYSQAHAAIASACMARLEREWESDEAEWIVEALDACKRAIASDPWISEAYSAKGQVFLRQHRFEEAEAEFRRALAINPNDDIAHSLLGRILFERGDVERAARAYKRAIKITPNYVWCWNDLAWAEWLLGRYQETERALTKVLSINPVDEVARVGVATAHYFRGELDAAVAAAQKSVEVNPNHPFSRPVLAVALAKQGRVAEAEALCQAVLAERAHDFLTSAALGVVYAIAGNNERLAAANRAALSIVAPRTPLNVNVAVHYAFLNRPEYATRWIAKAFSEGFDASTVLVRNPLLGQFAREFRDADNRRRRLAHAQPDAVPDADQGH